MNKWILGLLILGMTNVACAESPSAVISPRSVGDDNARQGGGGDGDGEVEEIELPAVKYQGLKTSGGQCEMYISVAEFEEEDGEHHHEILMKPVLTTADGHSPGGGTGEFFMFRLADNQYFDKSEKVENASPSLTAISLNKEVDGINPNDLAVYENEKSLIHLLRMDFAGTTAEELEETLEEVIAAEAMSTEQQVALNKVFQFFSRLKHGDHYHGVTCVNMIPQMEIEMVKFELGGHDHDHDDDHGDGGHGDGHDHGDGHHHP
ncbi:MAG: hypothetical protein AAF202_01510 [Pseudomonadota bacterium]